MEVFLFINPMGVSQTKSFFVCPGVRVFDSHGTRKIDISVGCHGHGHGNGERRENRGSHRVALATTVMGADAPPFCSALVVA